MIDSLEVRKTELKSTVVTRPRAVCTVAHIEAAADTFFFHLRVAVRRGVDARPDPELPAGPLMRAFASIPAF
jgi:hypothetical protein